MDRQLFRVDIIRRRVDDHQLCGALSVCALHACRERVEKVVRALAAAAQVGDGMLPTIAALGSRRAGSISTAARKPLTGPGAASASSVVATSMRVSLVHRMWSRRIVTTPRRARAELTTAAVVSRPTRARASSSSSAASTGRRSC